MGTNNGAKAEGVSVGNSWEQVPVRSCSAQGRCGWSSWKEASPKGSPEAPYLVTDELPLLLVVVLPQEPGFVGRQVHGILWRDRNIVRDQAQPNPAGANQGSMAAVVELFHVNS